MKAYQIYSYNENMLYEVHVECIDYHWKKLYELMVWINNNGFGKYTHNYYDKKYRFSFEDETTAILFKLRFG